MGKNNKSKKLIKSVIILIIILTAIVLLLYGGFILLIHYSSHTTYHIFGKNRKAEMEEKFGITVTDDIKFKKYEGFEFLAQMDYTLYIDKIDDYNKFMQDNVNGKITKKAENGIICDYEQNIKEISDYYEKDDIVYYYKWYGNIVNIEFYDKDNDGYYSASLNFFE